jgi:DNA-binding transcriptional MerR regulator/methylmalonyl-CoA mutase cobalamin-binding subunit
MQDDSSETADLLPITEVERQTGIRQATLRMWEKRYGFPQPLRDRHGDRVYPPSQVARLHAVRRLIDQGLRPGKIFSSAVTLEPADSMPPAAGSDGIPATCQHVFSLLRAYRLPELHAHFQHRLLDLGLRRFIIEFLAPLSTEVGLAWNRGELPVRCEHLYTQVALSFLHAKQAVVRTAADGRPKVVLATLTGEQHALGIMMAEAVMASLEMNCIQLGAETPALEVVAAARETAADIVALSFSSYFPRRAGVRMAASLRSALPRETALWIGGEGARAFGRSIPGILVLDSFDAIEPALARWRTRPIT